MAERTALDSLAREAATRLRAGIRADDVGVRGVEYKATAELMVEAREHFLTDAGAVDWRGQSYPYRLWVGEVYGAAGVPPEDRSRVSSALRYHISNVLRTRLDGDTLHSIGLRSESARDRSREQRQERAALLRSLMGSATRFEGEDAMRALAAVVALLERIEPEAVPALGEPGAERLKAVWRLVNRLRRAVPAE